jgi:hypothetical protein
MKLTRSKPRPGWKTQISSTIGLRLELDRSVRFENIEEIRKLEQDASDVHRVSLIVSAHQQHLLAVNDVTPRLEAIAPGIGVAARAWSKATLKLYGRRSVGIALGLANLNRLFGEPFDLPNLVE